VFDFEDAEIAELEAVSFCDFFDDHIKKFLDDLLCDDSFVACALCDLVYKDFLGDRFHGILSFYPRCGRGG